MPRTRRGVELPVDDGMGHVDALGACLARQGLGERPEPELAIVEHQAELAAYEKAA
jgi:hypothetical protein